MGGRNLIAEDEQKLYDILKMLKIEYTRYEHKPVCTIEEANQLDICIPGQHCKNLFLLNRKGNVHLYAFNTILKHSLIILMCI